MAGHPETHEQRGVVKWFNETRGYGFITPEVGRELFVHVSQIMTPEPKTLTEGQEVTFVLGTDLRGRPQAEQVVPLMSETPYR